MTSSNEVAGHEPAGWPCPGVFARTRHYVAEDALSLVLDGERARVAGLAGLKVWFAECGAACWPPDAVTYRLPWCPACERAWALQWQAPGP